MKQPIRIVPVLILALLGLSVALPAPAQTVLYEQLPNAFGGATSDGTTFTVADDFQLHASAGLQRIVWWGGYSNSPVPIPTGDAFTLRIYDDAGGQPGNAIATYSTGTEARVTQIGPASFEYAIDLATPLALENGRTYWLSIVDVPTSLSWGWFSSSYQLEQCQMGLACARRSFSGPMGPWDDPQHNNFSFRLVGAGGCTEVAIELQIEPAVINPRAGGRWVTCYLEPPAPYAADQIDQATVQLSTGRGSIAPDPEGPVELGDNDNDGVPDLALKFRRADVIGILEGNPTTLVVTGEFLSPAATCFHGSDDVRVIGETGPGPSEELAPGAGDPPGVALALHGTKPHPSRAGASLGVSFDLPEARPARLELLDIAGRRVAVREVGGLGPGRHAAQLSTGRLPAGVYRLRLLGARDRRELRVVVIP